MATTQDHILIKEVKDNILLLKDGSAVLILKVSAVNFGLLSNEEQMSMIFSFAQMLNSLSSSIQIVILSKRLDISSYIDKLSAAQKLQNNPLLADMMARYKLFVQSLIKERDVLDKNFYVTISVSPIEIGLHAGGDIFNKLKTLLEPRRDQVTKQLNRVGLKASQLTNEQIVKLFFEIYNPPENQPSNLTQKPQERNLTPQTNPQVQSSFTKQPLATTNTLPRQPTNISQVNPEPKIAKNHPFVVEELADSP